MQNKSIFARQHTVKVKWINRSSSEMWKSVPIFVQQVEAMAEARRISSDPSVKGYTDMDALKTALEEDLCAK